MLLILSQEHCQRATAVGADEEERHRAVYAGRVSLPASFTQRVAKTLERNIQIRKQKLLRIFLKHSSRV